MDNKLTHKGIELSTEQLLKSSVFQGLGRLAFIYKKTEKLATALYMITNFIKDEEPIKSQIREKALNLLSINIALCSISPTDRNSCLKNYEATVIEVISLCGIARQVGFISEMNFTVLKQEFENLLNLMTTEGQKLPAEGSSILSSSFFDIGTVPVTPASPKASLATTPVSRPKESPVVSMSSQIQRERSQATDSIKDKRTYGAVEEKKTGRRELILGLLKKKQGLNIKDFSRVISGCSEKTIQRELLAMVADGSLRKEGERRWSHYYTV